MTDIVLIDSINPEIQVSRQFITGQLDEDKFMLYIPLIDKTIYVSQQEASMLIKEYAGWGPDPDEDEEEDYIIHDCGEFGIIKEAIIL